ncbi:MAG TPA: HD domain-containing phosphohydrolase [Gemmataceae bacterium]|nr:HD domain-containing phosphohydrolase [Gemmataceae bacterium]
MTETATLLGKIASLRQRLKQAQGLASEASSAAAVLFTDEDAPIDLNALLQKQVDLGNAQQNLLGDSIRQLSNDQQTGIDNLALPSQLTAHARRLLEQGRGILGSLRSLSETMDDLASAKGTLPADESLDGLYRDVTAMADTTLRLIQAFPNAPSAQLRLCHGLEPILRFIALRVAALKAKVEQRLESKRHLQVLKSIMTDLHGRKPVDVQSLIRLAEAILEDAKNQLPLRFYPGSGTSPSDWIAGHGLNVAQVIARVVRHDPELRARPLDAVLAALVHDIGMMAVPTEILAQKEPIPDESQSLVERHVSISVSLAGRLFPGASWLLDAIEAHHERLDGTGYPGGKRGTQISPLARLLAVCDVYAAMRATRPHRPARESRTALTDTLLLADQGQLDRQAAERLLTLSFYPVGSIVEMTDGATALVVATPLARNDLNAPSRPVVKLLTDTQGRPCSTPRYLDLGQSDHGGIVRTLPPHEYSSIVGEIVREAV